MLVSETPSLSPPPPQIPLGPLYKKRNKALLFYYLFFLFFIRKFIAHKNKKRIGDKAPPPPLTNLNALATRSADTPIPIPTTLPARTSRSTPAQPRFTESSIYPYLETNVDDAAMCFTGGGEEVIPARRSEWSVAMHGPDTPFRHWTVMREYVSGLFGRNGYGSLVDCGVSVERAVKEGEEWVLTVRRQEEEDDDEKKAGGAGGEDVWSEERFDAVVVASGHFNVPWIPAIEGLEEFERARTGSVLHSKMFRGRDAFRGKVSSVLTLFNSFFSSLVFCKSGLTIYLHSEWLWSAHPSRAQTLPTT